MTNEVVKECRGKEEAWRQPPKGLKGESDKLQFLWRKGGAWTAGKDARKGRDSGLKGGDCQGRG